MLKRIGYYLVGVVLGSLLVMVFFGDRDLQCSYFPNDRVLSDLRKKEITFSPTAKCKWDCAELDSLAFDYILNNGEVDFSKSQTKEESQKAYYIQSKKFEKEFSVVIENYDSTAIIVDVMANGSCDCR